VFHSPQGSAAGRLAVCCADIGSVAKKRFGWARRYEGRKEEGATSGTDIRKLVAGVAADLASGLPVALGLECPLFVPIREDPAGLTSARVGEGSRPWSAGAGAGSLATGLTQSVWILRDLRRSAPVGVPAFLDWEDFRKAGVGLFLWEAFVTSDAKGRTHAADAEIAVNCFVARLPDIPAANAIHETLVYSLIGAALLRTGWSTDLGLLETPCVVIKA